MAQMQPGTYKARIVNYTISTTQKGDPQVEVLFEYNDGDNSQVGGTSHQVRWWGHLTEKSSPWTLKALDVMGFKGNSDEDFSKIADGVEGGMLDLSKEVLLVLEQDDNGGKKYIKVRWINDPERTPGGFKNALSRGEAKVKLGALNLAGQMAMLRSQAPVKAPTTRPTPGATQAAREPGDDVDFDFGVM